MPAAAEFIYRPAVDFTFEAGPISHFQEFKKLRSPEDCTPEDSFSLIFRTCTGAPPPCGGIGFQGNFGQDKWVPRPTHTRLRLQRDQFQRRKQEWLRRKLGDDKLFKVAWWLVEGRSRTEIAASLELAPSTLRDMIRRIYRRMEVQSSTQLMASFYQGKSPDVLQADYPEALRRLLERGLDSTAMQAYFVRSACLASGAQAGLLARQAGEDDWQCLHPWGQGRFILTKAWQRKLRDHLWVKGRLAVGVKNPLPATLHGCTRGLGCQVQLPSQAMGLLLLGYSGNLHFERVCSVRLLAQAAEMGVQRGR